MKDVCKKIKEEVGWSGKKLDWNQFLLYLLEMV